VLLEYRQNILFKDQAGFGIFLFAHHPTWGHGHGKGDDPDQRADQEIGCCD